MTTFEDHWEPLEVYLESSTQHWAMDNGKKSPKYILYDGILFKSFFEFSG
jgi:hypothetical protein